MDEEKVQEIEVLDMDVELQVFDKVDAAVKLAKKRCADIVLSYDTPKEITEAKSFIYQNLRKLKTSITAVHKIACAQLVADKKEYDATKNKLLDAVEEMIEEKYAPIKVLEDAETIRLAEEELKKEQEEAAAEAARQADIEKRERELAEAEAQVNAEKEKLQREARERQIAEDAKKQAAEDAKQALIDAENKRQKQEEAAALAAVNAENAKVAAEAKATNDKFIAEVNAENAKAAAVQKAKDEAAAEKVQWEEQLAEEARAEETRLKELDDAEQLRIADTEHRSKIHQAIYTQLLGSFDNILELSLRMDLAKAITQALIDGKIPHTTINY